ncbi:5_t:CDS:2, partial [Dentiscutata heterogama]
MSQNKNILKVQKGIPDNFNRPIPTKNSLLLDNNNEKIVLDWFKNDLKKLGLNCTGSMDDYIAAAKDCILQVAEKVNELPRVRLKFGFCGYRDHDDESTRLEIFDFTDSCEKFRKNISTVKSFGGGDSPEDVLGGLYAAMTRLTWRSDARIIFHIGDAPPHGKKFHSDADDYPNGCPCKLTDKGVLRRMQSKKIRYVFGKIDSCTDTMIKIFRSIIGEFLIYELYGGDPVELVNKFSDSIFLSITSTLEDKKKVSQQKRDIYPNRPDWKYIKDFQDFRQCVTLCYIIPENAEQVKDVEFFSKENLVPKSLKFKIAPLPFATGTEKYAYFATSNLHADIVIKEYKSGSSFQKYLDSVEISAITSYLSIKFNSIAEKNNINIPAVNFLSVNILCTTVDNKTKYYIVEQEFVNAQFIRFNSNGGFIQNYRPTLEAFVHFTYEHTEKYLIVTDLQGIELQDKFILTDPAIHCVDRSRFGKTNLGIKGIDKCLLTSHKCNDICKKLELTSF